MVNLCIVCSDRLIGKKSTAKFCSRRCEGEYYRTRDGKINPKRATHCEGCGTPFTTRVIKRKFCSSRCKNTKYQGNHPHISKVLGLSASTVGAISELRVATDLLSKGYPIFRALSPACSCDLAALVGERLYRIEVTTGHIYPSGRITHPKHHDSTKHDIIAIVIATTGNIIYEPPLPPCPARPS